MFDVVRRFIVEFCLYGVVVTPAGDKPKGGNCRPPLAMTVG